MPGNIQGNRIATVEFKERAPFVWIFHRSSTSRHSKFKRTVISKNELILLMAHKAPSPTLANNKCGRT
jgi:hypothetical protein